MQKTSDIIRTYFYMSTQASWEAMLKACELAEKTIDLEQYIFVPDETGKRFVDVLVRKAEAGVRVRLLLDMVGSLSMFLSDIPDLLMKKGVEVQFFNPVKMWRIGNVTSHFFRDHRKLLVIDNAVAFTGGVGIEDRMKDWRDTSVEVSGSIVQNFTYIFDLVWRRMQKGKYIRFRRPPYYHKNYDLLINSPRFRQRFIYFTYISQIRNASKSIYLATPYFVPDHRFLRVLRIAAHRGVDVRLIMPTVSDHYMIDHVQAWYVTQALKAGVRVFTYPKPFYHAKMAVVDGTWASVGSFNIDNLSILFNHEANLCSTDHAFVNEVSYQFANDLMIAKEVTYEQWKNRPSYRKVLEFLSWPFHKFF